MARAEGNRTAGEKIGRAALLSGVVIGTVGLIGMWADWELPNEAIALAGAGLAASGVIFEKVTGRKK